MYNANAWQYQSFDYDYSRTTQSIPISSHLPGVLEYNCSNGTYLSEPSTLLDPTIALHENVAATSILWPTDRGLVYNSASRKRSVLDVTSSETHSRREISTVELPRDTFSGISIANTSQSTLYEAPPIIHYHHYYDDDNYALNCFNSFNTSEGTGGGYHNYHQFGNYYDNTQTDYHELWSNQEYNYHDLSPQPKPNVVLRNSCLPLLPNENYIPDPYLEGQLEYDNGYGHNTEREGRPRPECVPRNPINTVTKTIKKTCPTGFSKLSSKARSRLQRQALDTSSLDAFTKRVTLLPTSLLNTPQKLYHYTTEEGAFGILKDKFLRPKEMDWLDTSARYGNGIYFTDIPPSSKTELILLNNYNKVLVSFTKFTEFCFEFQSKELPELFICDDLTTSNVKQPNERQRKIWISKVNKLNLKGVKGTYYFRALNGIDTPYSIKEMNF